MGIETIIFVALSAASAMSKISAANDQAKNITDNANAQTAANTASANLQSKEKAKQIRTAAARQTSSFLTSGLTLDGTPSTVIGETFQTGMEDLALFKSNVDTSNGNIVSNANSQSKSIIGAARSQAISDIAGSFAGFSGGAGGSGMFDSIKSSVGYGMNNAGFGVQAYDLLDNA